MNELSSRVVVAAVVVALLMAPALASAQILINPVNLPPGATLVGPAQNAVIAAPAVRFQWLAGTGLTGMPRYEICVRRLNQTCESPDATIIRPTGTLLTEPLPAPRFPPAGPRPGDPNFEPPVGGTGTPPYFLATNLPIRYQGTRLQWSVTTCVPREGATRLGLTNEICSASASRDFTWALPVAALGAPVDGITLPGLNVAFSWQYANTQGIEYSLVCITIPGAACAAAAAVQPFVYVARIQGTSQYAFPQELASFMGRTLVWTVATCNAELGCAYQALSRRFVVPILDGTFESIYPVTQNEKCINCHRMFQQNPTYTRHVALGRFTPEDFRDRTRHVAACRNCHTAATGFADGWNAPEHLPFDQPLGSGFCGNLKFEPGLSSGGVQHLRNDRLIVWAVGHIPGLGVTRWQELMSKWMNKGAPCPCDHPAQRGCAGKPLLGQFTP